ncbi:MAG TPA: hypothetical protein VK503_04730, partial [Candidatus Bathyarchaeia archaeon]|nr:hypothetical protein [Candidatus Bathyarchaeia archaeon]
PQVPPVQVIVDLIRRGYHDRDDIEAAMKIRYDGKAYREDVNEQLRLYRARQPPYNDIPAETGQQPAMPPQLPANVPVTPATQPPTDAGGSTSSTETNPTQPLVPEVVDGVVDATTIEQRRRLKIP